MSNSRYLCGYSRFSLQYRFCGGGLGSFLRGFWGRRAKNARTRRRCSVISTAIGAGKVVTVKIIILLLVKMVVHLR